MNELEQRIAIARAVGPQLFVIHKQIHDPFGYYRENAKGYTSSIAEAWKVTEEVGRKYISGRDTDPDRVRLEPAPLLDYLNDLNAIRNAVGLMCEKHGWAFQEPYINSLKLIVSRKRGTLNPDQLLFWLAEATASQRCEAFLDALAIINLKNECNASL